MRIVRAWLWLLAACSGGGLPIPPYAPQPSTALVPVPYPPPPAWAEFVPSQPVRGSVWVDGEWQWRRRRWAWQQGRWVIPAAGTRFSPWTMVRGDDGTLYYGLGVWRDAKGEAVTEARALATAKSTGEVVNPEGERENVGGTIRPARHDPPTASTPPDGGLDP